METILNLLPLTEEERAAFQDAAGAHEQLFLPSATTRANVQVDPTLLARATVILGCPDPQSLAGLPHLKWLQAWFAGVDPYLAPGVLPQGTLLTSAVGAYGTAVSEHMLAMTLALMKNLPRYRDHQTARRWRDEGQVKSPVGATVLVLGTGDLGSHFAALMKALGSYTIGLNRHPDRPVPGFDRVRSIDDLDALLPQADLVASTLPGGPETYHILNRERIRAMKPDAILVNAGRGSGVDCLALAEALKEGRLWGAALDVTEPEPLPPDHPLWDCPNLLLTPHTAGGDRLDATVRAINAIALDNLKRYLAGEPLKNQPR